MFLARRKEHRMGPPAGAILFLGGPSALTSEAAFNPETWDADGATQSILGITYRDSTGRAVPGRIPQGTFRVPFVDVDASTVSVFPPSIQSDNVDGAAITVTVRDTLTGAPRAGLTVTLAIVSGTGTLTQPAAVTDANGVAIGSAVSNTPGTLEIKATVLEVDITQTVSITVTSVYAAPNILDNLSFETGWDSYTDGGVGDPTANAPHTIARSEEQAFAGDWSTKFGWEANATDKGAAFFRSLGTSVDELWVRLYFWMNADWSITSVQKWTRFRTASTQVGGWYLSDSKGLAWGFDLEASAVTASIIPKASIPTGQWNSLECHYRRNGDDEPNVAMWLNGVAQVKANGADPAGFGLTWLDGRLYAGARNNSTQINMIQHVGTLNAGNTGAGFVYLDRIAASTAGRIGP